MDKCSVCGAPIIWMTLSNGGILSCNPEEIRYTQKAEGGISLVTQDGKLDRGIFDRNGDKIGYLPHSFMCKGTGGR